MNSPLLLSATILLTIQLAPPLIGQQLVADLAPGAPLTPQSPYP